MKNEKVAKPAASLDGARVWIVTDGTAEVEGWQDGFVAALREVGASSVDVLGVSGVLSLTARGWIEQGADKLARTLRFTRRGEPETDATEAFVRAKPDIVIVDDPGVLRTLEVIRETTRQRAVHVGMIASYLPVDAWCGSRADAYVAPSDLQLDALRRPGMSDAAFTTAGPPLPRGFDVAIDGASARAELGLDPAEKVILFDATTMPPPLIDRIIFQLGVTGVHAMTLFYYGHNREAADVLRQSAAAHRYRARMFGYTEAYPKTVAAADLVVVGPDNPLMSAYLAQHRPLLAVDPSAIGSLPSVEGAVVVLSDAVAIGDVVARVVTGGVDAGHAEAARKLGRPEGTRDAAEAIARIWRDRSRLNDAGPMDAVVETSATGSRFEEIGDPSTVGQPDVSPLSRAAAKEQLAALILEERKVEGEIAQLARERDKWFARLELAQEERDGELEEIGRRNVDRFVGLLQSASERMNGIQLQKEQVRRRVAGARRVAAEPATGASSEADAYERRFRELEMRGEMNRLRRRADGDVD